MQSILQILLASPVEDREWEGRKYKSQTAECIILNDDGTPAQVGVLRVPEHLHGKVEKGVYVGSFALKPDRKTRQIGAVLVGLQPYTVKGAPTSAAAKAQ